MIKALMLLVILFAVGAFNYFMWDSVYNLIPNELAILSPLGFDFMVLIFWLRLWSKTNWPIVKGITLLLTGVGAIAFAVLSFVIDTFFLQIRMKLSDEQLQKVVNYAPTMSTVVYDTNGQKMCVFARENRTVVSLEDISPKIISAFIAAEDGDFYKHAGIDLVSIGRALVENWKSGHTKQGASTITQQILKRLVVGNEKSYDRKATEAVAAIELEKLLSKESILYIYLNEIYLGNNSYGVEAAAQMYFHKSAKNVTWGEAAMLAGLAKAPAKDSPHAHFNEAQKRQSYVLRRLMEDGLIAPYEHDEVDAESFVIAENSSVNTWETAYPCAEILRELVDAYGEDRVYNQGFAVYSTIDLRWQKIAENVVASGLESYEKIVGDGKKTIFRGPSAHDAAYEDGHCDKSKSVLPVGLRDSRSIVVKKNSTSISVCVRGQELPVYPNDAKILLAWKRDGVSLQIGDVIPVRLFNDVKQNKNVTTTTQYAMWAPRTTKHDDANPLQASLIAMDQNSGEVRVIVGGYDFHENQFNHGTQGHPQVGSSIKPYVYLNALLHGATVTDTVVDRRVCYGNGWCPKNYDGSYKGAMPIRSALAQSRNTVSVQLLVRYELSNVIDTMSRLGIDTIGRSAYGLYVPKHASIAVGSAAITLWDQVAAYAVIASNGKEMPMDTMGELEKEDFSNHRRRGMLVNRVIDNRGKLIYEQSVEVAKQPQAIPADAAYAMLWLMRGAVEDSGGTATRVRELGRPAAGKTGTSDLEQNVWFLGFTADLVAGVWVGREKPEHIGKKATGGGTALPFWLEFMKQVYALDSEKYPPREFMVPHEVVRIPQNGRLVPYMHGNVPAQLIVKKQ